MTVTEIEEISGSKRRLYLDGESAFVLYKGELRKYQIEEGCEISDDTVLELRTHVLPKRAKLRAMNLLQGRQYTEKQLMDKLLQGGYETETAREAVDYVKSYRYIDDKRYACEYIACRTGSHSLAEIRQKLMQKGIGKEVFLAALEELEKDGIISDEESVIRRIIEKKYSGEKVSDDKEKRRIYAWFYRKGFSPELIRRVMADSFA